MTLTTPRGGDLLTEVDSATSTVSIIWEEGGLPNLVSVSSGSTVVGILLSNDIIGVFFWQGTALAVSTIRIV